MDTQKYCMFCNNFRTWCCKPCKEMDSKYPLEKPYYFLHIDTRLLLHCTTCMNNLHGETDQCNKCRKLNVMDRPTKYNYSGHDPYILEYLVRRILFFVGNEKYVPLSVLDKIGIPQNSPLMKEAKRWLINNDLIKIDNDRIYTTPKTKPFMEEREKYEQTFKQYLFYLKENTR